MSINHPSSTSLPPHIKIKYHYLPSQKLPRAIELASPLGITNPLSNSNSAQSFLHEREWVLAGFAKSVVSMMPMVKYGIGAWTILVWTFLSSPAPLRRLAYEVHVPRYASYNVWFAVGTIPLNWILRGVLLVYKNFLVRLVSHTCDNKLKIGYYAELRMKGKDIPAISITIPNSDAAQHLGSNRVQE
ncbi:MAG: hypothetical protein M1839_000927 [Geoglossum umbratile]|nr:MAG: hypothetical protein M1839_000927 [Geoglossum umbratile]